MQIVHSIRPTDIVALAAFQGNAFPNQARTRARLEGDNTLSLTVGMLMEQWIMSENRHTIVAMDGHTILGLISARHRGSKAVWEIDWLVVGACDDENQTAQMLLNRLTMEASAARVRKMFLRLPEDSPLHQGLLAAGFSAYATELLLVCSDFRTRSLDVDGEALQPCTTGDEHGLFRLYCAAVPSTVRAVEGMTLEEWRANQDNSLGRQREYLLVANDRPDGWLRFSRKNRCGHFQCLGATEDSEQLNQMVGYALSRLTQCERVATLVPEYQPVLTRTLARDWGFQEVSRYHLFAKQLAVQVKDTQLVPAHA